MSQNINSIHTETFVTGANLEANRNRFLKVTADNTVNLGTGVTDPVIGVQEDIPFAAAGAQVGVCLLGSPQISVSAAIAAGAKATCSAAGQAVIAAATNDYFAIMIQAATAANELPQAKLVTGRV